MMMMHSMYQEEKLTGNKALVEPTPGGEIQQMMMGPQDPNAQGFFPPTMMGGN